MKTHIILSARVTDEHGGDSPQLLPLLRSVLARGHRPARVVGDKAYLSRENLQGAADLGVDPFIPFKTNSVARAKCSSIWQQKYHFFMARRPEFDLAYNQRSNVESVNASIKRTLGEPLLSHNSAARFNELLTRLLVYNVGVIITQAFEHGIEPTVRSSVARHPVPKVPGFREPDCESVPFDVKEILTAEPEELL